MVLQSTRRRSYAPGRRRREALVQAAIRLVAERGPAGASVDAVAAAAGVTKGSAYWHFPDKDALLETAAERALEAWTNETLRYVLGQPSAAGRVRAAITAHAADLMRPGSVAVSLTRMASEPALGARVLPAWRQRLRQIIGSSPPRHGARQATTPGSAEAVLCGLLGLGILWDATRDRLVLQAGADGLSASMGMETPVEQHITKQSESVLF